MTFPCNYDSNEMTPQFQITFLSIPRIKRILLDNANM